MKTTKRLSGPQRLVNEIQLARTRLARAENKWALADEQAREARRRRKEARQAARRAKKQARQAGKELDAAKEALALTEEKFAAAVEKRARIQKLIRSRLAAKAVAARRPKQTRRTVRRSSVPKKILVRAKRKSAVVVKAGKARPVSAKSARRPKPALSVRPRPRPRPRKLTDIRGRERVQTGVSQAGHALKTPAIVPAPAPENAGAVTASLSAGSVNAAAPASAKPLEPNPAEGSLKLNQV